MVKFLTKKQKQETLDSLQPIADELIKKYDCDFIRYVKENGFVKHNQKITQSSSKYIYFNKEKSLAVKIPYIYYYTGYYEPPKVSIPTIIIPRKRKPLNKGYDYIFIQPLADTENKWLAEEEIKKKMKWKNYFEASIDFQPDNCAWFKGCPVLIDW